MKPSNKGRASLRRTHRRAGLATADAPAPLIGWERQYGAWRDSSSVRLALQLRREAKHVSSWLERHPCPSAGQLREELNSQAMALSIAADEIEEMEARLWMATHSPPPVLHRLRTWVRVRLLQFANAVA